MPFLCRRGAANAVKKPAKDEPDAGDVKVACAEDEMKHEAKDEESNDSDGEEKVAGEDADVRDVIYNLEILGIKYCVHFPKTFQAVGSHIEWNHMKPAATILQYFTMIGTNRRSI